MLSLRSSSPSTFSSLAQPLHRSNYKNPSSIRKPNASASFVCRIGVEDITGIVHNKVLIAAAVSTAIGQISKPFTSSLFYGENVNLRRFIGSGGFPSSHSSGVVAAATSLGLERGFSDSIFGMSVIFAAIVMDAEGEVLKYTTKRIFAKTAEEAELKAMEEGIVMAAQLQLEAVIIESDCKNAVYGVQKKQHVSWEHQTIVDSILNVGSLFSSILFKYVPRNSNVQAHKLARWGWDNSILDLCSEDVETLFYILLMNDSIIDWLSKKKNSSPYWTRAYLDSSLAARERID